MARLRFQKFEKELSPVEQGVGTPSYPAAPPPQQMVGNEVLSESRAYERLGQSILDFGSTLGKVITNEQGRIRKEVWEQGMPLALAELDRELEQRIIDDYQQGLSPAESKSQWEPYVKTLIDNIKRTKSWKSITHEGDRNKLETILRDRAHSMEIRALQQSYALQNELQSSMVQNQITGALNDQLLEIQDPSFNKNSEGEGLGHTIPQDIFLKSHVIGPANAEIEQILEANNISGRQAQRLKLWAASAVNNFQYNALSHHVKIKTGIAAANWQEKYNNLVKTAALGGSSVRRRLVDGTVSEDSRLDLVEEHLQGGRAAELIGPKDALRLREDAKVIFDLNDVNNDIRNNPLDTYWMLRTDEPTKEEKEEIIADSGEEEWNRLNELRGGYYPSLMGPERESKIKDALGAVQKLAKVDSAQITEQLNRGIQILLDPDSEPSDRTNVLNPDFINKHRGGKYKEWQLDQVEAVLPYADKAGLTLRNINQKSAEEILEDRKSLDPALHDFGIEDKEFFRAAQVAGIYRAVNTAFDELIKLRLDDPASIGHQQVLREGEDSFSPKGYEMIARDQMNWKSIPVDEANFKVQVERLVRAETISLWSLSMRKQRGDEWNELTKAGTGVEKKEFLDTLIKKSGAFASTVMTEFTKVEGVTWGDSFYTEMNDSLNLDSFNLSQRHSAKNRESKNISVIFPKVQEGVSYTFKTLRDLVSADKDVREFLDSFGTGTEEWSSILDTLTDYLLYLKSEKKDLTLDDVIDAAVTHLISDQYTVIQGSESETRATARIATRNVPQRNGEPVDKEDLNDLLIEYTERLMKSLSAKAGKTGWNISGMEDSDLWQWKTNSDETGLTLFFWNDDSLMFQEALYKKEEFPLTWSDLQGIHDMSELYIRIKKGSVSYAEQWFKDRPWFKHEEIPVEPEVVEPRPEPAVVELSPELSIDEQIKGLKDLYPDSYGKMTNQQVRQAIRAAQR